MEFIKRFFIKNKYADGFINYIPSGLDEIHEEGKEEVLGNAKQILFDDGDCRPYLPTGEAQKRGSVETLSCVSQSAANALETIINYYDFLVKENKATDEQREIVKVWEYFGLFDERGEANVSDRYIAKVSGTGANGNTFKNVWDAIRHYGLVPEALWPWDDDYYATVKAEVVKKGMEVPNYLDINYEFVNSYNQPDAQRYGVIPSSVFAWNGLKDGRYVATSLPFNHATVKSYFKPSTEHGIYDSYEPFDKKTEWNFNFGWGVLPTIHLKRKLSPYNLDYIKYLRDERGFRYIQRTDKTNGGRGQVYELLADGIRELNEQEKKEIGIAAFMQREDATGINEADYKKINDDRT